MKEWFKTLAETIRNFLISGLVKEERLKEIEESLDKRMDRADEQLMQHRKEAQAGHDRLRNDFFSGYLQLENRIMTASEQVRKDNKEDNLELRHWMESQFQEQFKKIDNFTNTVLAVQSQRRHEDK